MFESQLQTKTNSLAFRFNSIDCSVGCVHPRVYNPGKPRYLSFSNIQTIEKFLLAFNAQQEPIREVITSDPPLTTETGDSETESILRDIEELQEGLERLKLKVERRRVSGIARDENAVRNTRNPKTVNRSGPLRVGEEVIIRNPKKGQEKTGTVGKVHASGWITVNGWKKVNGVRVETKIKRIRANLIRKQN